jgi:hypothetical protein
VHQIPDSQIPCVKVANPILDARAEKRLDRAKALYTPRVPLSVVKRAHQAASATGVTYLLLAVLTAKLTGNLSVRLRPVLLEQAGLGEGQAKRAAAALASVGVIAINSAPGKRREITLTDGELVHWLRTRGAE